MQVAGGLDPYLKGGDEATKVQEATTRTEFLDHFIDALGWSRGARADVQEEVRLRGDNTVFIDYVGTAHRLEPGKETPVPLLVVEAKAGDKEFVRPRDRRRHVSEDELLSEAIVHVRAELSDDTSPVSGAWQAYLKQILKYVRLLYVEAGHKVKAVVLTNGDWMLVFPNAYKTFFEAGEIGAYDFKIFKRGDFVSKSDQIFTLLSKRMLDRSFPDWVRPQHISRYLRGQSVVGVFLGAQVVHLKRGPGRLGRSPEISVVPHVILQTDQEQLLTVFDEASEYTLTDRKLGEQLTQVADAGAALLAKCATALSQDLTPSPVTAFPGFSAWRQYSVSNTDVVAASDDFSSEWAVATGDHCHFLLEAPKLDNCVFHAWSAANAIGQAAQPNAIGSPSIDNPRTIFPDGHTHHCAHGGLLSDREERCKISPFEERLCCQACVFRDRCWSPTELALLPCASAPPTAPVDFGEF
jgi:hypothetical protein